MMKSLEKKETPTSSLGQCFIALIDNSTLSMSILIDLEDDIVTPGEKLNILQEIAIHIFEIKILVLFKIGTVSTNIFSI